MPEDKFSRGKQRQKAVDTVEKEMKINVKKIVCGNKKTRYRLENGSLGLTETLQKQ